MSTDAPRLDASSRTPAAEAPDFAALDDRALDAALAVALFGWIPRLAYLLSDPSRVTWGGVVEPKWDGWSDGVMANRPPENEAELRRCVEDFPVEPPSYSADAADAFDVVEAMTDPERAGRVYNVVAMRTWYGWAVTFRVGFDTPPFDTLDGWTTAKTFPRAVALAALSALYAAGALPAPALALLASPGA